MPDTNDHDHGGENADKPFNLIPLDRAPGLVFPMIDRFDNGLPEPMVIGVNGRPVAALITMEDLLRLRDYDQRALDSEDSFYFQLDRRLHHADTEQVVTDLNDFARSLGPLGVHWAGGRPRGEKD